MPPSRLCTCNTTPKHDQDSCYTIHLRPAVPMKPSLTTRNRYTTHERNIATLNQRASQHSSLRTKVEIHIGSSLTLGSYRSVQLMPPSRLYTWNTNPKRSQARQERRWYDIVLHSASSPTTTAETTVQLQHRKPTCTPPVRRTTHQRHWHRL